MGNIVDKAKELWLHGHHEIELAEAIDAELAALRQEIEALKRDIKDGSAFTLEYKQPAPEPELQRGDFVSYMDGSKKVWGIFYCYEDDRVRAYWQQSGGNFLPYLGYMLRDEVTFEFRPEK